MTNPKREDENRPVFELLTSPELQVINLGLRRFADTFEQQGLRFIDVDWRPPSDSDDDLASILKALDQ